MPVKYSIFSVTTKKTNSYSHTIKIFLNLIELTNNTASRSHKNIDIISVWNRLKADINVSFSSIKKAV